MQSIDTRQDLKPCPDSEGLGVYGNDRITIGHVTEVNGPDSLEIPNFVPTRHELIHLFKYWANLLLEIRFDYFLYGDTGSSESRRLAFAGRRMDRIASVLNEGEAQKAYQEVEAEFAKNGDPKVWSIFKNGTEAERQACQDQFCEKLSETPRR